SGIDAHRSRLPAAQRPGTCSRACRPPLGPPHVPQQGRPMTEPEFTIHRGLLACLLTGTLAGPAGPHFAFADTSTQDALLPVSTASDGFSADLGYALRKDFSWDNAYSTGDHNLYYF